MRWDKVGRGGRRRNTRIHGHRPRAVSLRTLSGEGGEGEGGGGCTICGMGGRTWKEAK